MENQNRLLIIDDEIEMLYSLRDVLSDEDYYVDIADTASKALEQAQAYNYSLVLLDIKMTDINGLKLLKLLKKYLNGTYFILMTGYPSLETSIKALRQGATDYLIKPFPFSDLISTVERYLKQRNNFLLKEHLVEDLQSMVTNVTVDLENFTNNALKKLNNL